MSQSGGGVRPNSEKIIEALAATASGTDAPLSLREKPVRRKRGRKTPKTATRTFGPVPDLERHLPTDWWRTLFNAVYLKTDGDVIEDPRNTLQETDLLVAAAGIRPTDSILDLCCGQGRHSIELAKRGFENVTGIDRSRYLVRLARRRAQELGLDVNFREGDARKFRLPAVGFDCICMMGNSFGYFDSQEDDYQVLKRVRRALAPGGVFALDITDGDWIRRHYEPRSWEWIDQNHLVCRERSLSRDQARLICREVVIHAERGVIADQFYAERLYSQTQIQQLAEKSGFEGIVFHTMDEVKSDRNADLGMMANRVFMTSRTPRRSVSLAPRMVPFSDVAVILGDPRLPDTVKKDGHFNAEDLDTVRRLKSALSELGQYRFEFLDNHASLLARLAANPPDFVFNLCDEGLNNDALLELHVPAILEALGIEYSGSGPGCLGLCYDKALVRSVAASLDIPVPGETYFGLDDHAATIPSVLPALIKPNCGDSSLGITKEAVAFTAEQAINHIETLRALLPDRSLLIQEFLSGPEYSVGIIGNPGLGLNVLPVLEVDFSGLDADLPKILSYESKWDPDSPYWTQIRYRAAEIDEDTLRKLTDWSSLLFERLRCRDYARFDFRADADGTVKLLEVNPNPGWCWDGKLNLMGEMAGYRYADLLGSILDAAQSRVMNRLDRHDDHGERVQAGLPAPEQVFRPDRQVGGRDGSGGMFT